MVEHEYRMVATYKVVLLHSWHNEDSNSMNMIQYININTDP